MDLSIVIVSWNTRDFLRRCLESVQRTCDSLSYEVLVVDNGSTDGSVELVAEEFPDVVLLRNTENVGFARANNQAIQRSRGRHVLLLNSDAELIGSTAQRIVEFLDAHPEAGALGGQLLNPDGSFQSSYADFPSLGGELLLLTGLARWLRWPGYPFYPEARSQQVRSVDWVSGALLAVRRSAIEAVGALDEDYFMYTEETDWCYRLRQAGWATAYLPEAKAYHYAGGSARRVPEVKRAQLYHSKRLFFQKHYGSALARCFSALVRSTSVLKLVPWFIYGIASRSERRLLARQNVAAYRYLLAHF
ncbi:MAG TPA: glycosyltransferase family 2 protein [Chloroflexota bacterium]|nr:glycosyltransferase family 2 protein [Chloroflexota bacterium]